MSSVRTITAGGVVGAINVAINVGTSVVMLLPKFPLMPMLMADYVRSGGNELGLTFRPVVVREEVDVLVDDIEAELGQVGTGRPVAVER